MIDSVGDDTARSEWREPWPSAAGGPMHVLSAPIVAPPPPPTDARIVEAWQAARVRDRVYGYAHDDAAGHALAAVMVDGHPVTRAEFQAAWSRVLAAKVAASDAARTEAARRVVLGPIDDESEA